MREKFYVALPSPTTSALPLFGMELKVGENSGLALPSRTMSASLTLGLEFKVGENSGLALPRGKCDRRPQVGPTMQD